MTPDNFYFFKRVPPNPSLDSEVAAPYPMVRFNVKSIQVYNNRGEDFRLVVFVHGLKLGEFFCNMKTTSTFNDLPLMVWRQDTPVHRQDLANRPVYSKRTPNAGSPAESKGIMEIADVISEL